MRTLRSSYLLLILVTVGLPMSGCIKLDPTSPDPLRTCTPLSSVSVEGFSALFVPEVMPVGNTVSPTIAASDSFVLGSSVLMFVTVPDSATALLIGTPDCEGFFRVPITPAALMRARGRLEKGSWPDGAIASWRRQRPASASSVELVVRVSISSGQSSAALRLAYQCPRSSSTLTFHTFHASERAANSNQFQFSLSWVSPVDLDLHVQVPIMDSLGVVDSTDIFWGNSVAFGGTLDLDSNGGCSIDSVGSENITWTTSVPPRGLYKVRVDLWSACAQTSDIPYVVTIRKCGIVVQTIQGAVSPSQADQGGRFSGVLVASVPFTSCSEGNAAVATSDPSTRPWRRSLSRAIGYAHSPSPRKAP
jgi:hypothetical protein